jgi:hypothetical protein
VGGGAGAAQGNQQRLTLEQRSLHRRSDKHACCPPTYACPAPGCAAAQELSWESFRALLVGGDEPRVRQQAVGLLQNLCKGGDSISQVRLSVCPCGCRMHG